MIEKKKDDQNRRDGELIDRELVTIDGLGLSSLHVIPSFTFEYSPSRLTFTHVSFLFYLIVASPRVRRCLGTTPKARSSRTQSPAVIPKRTFWRVPMATLTLSESTGSKRSIRPESG